MIIPFAKDGRGHVFIEDEDVLAVALHFQMTREAGAATHDFGFLEQLPAIFVHAEELQHGTFPWAVSGVGPFLDLTQTDGIIGDTEHEAGGGEGGIVLVGDIDFDDDVLRSFLFAEESGEGAVSFDRAVHDFPVPFPGFPA